MGAWAKSKGTPYFLMGPGLLWLTIFFVLPMLFMLSVSLYQGSLDTTFEMTWHFENFKTAITDFDTQFVRSFIYAGAATLLCLVIAYPLSYAIAFKAGRWRQVMLLCVIAPFFTTYLIRTYAWQTILSNDGTVVNVFQTLGILGDDGTLLKTPTAVIAGLTYNFLPFMVLPIYASLEQMDTRLIEAGRDLYSNARTAFFKITLPISMPGVIAGTLLTFIPAVGDYVNATFLGSPNQAMIGNVIQSQYLVTKDYPIAAAISFIMMALIVLMIAIYIKFAGEESLMGDEAEVVTAK
ncbi:MAG: ABC transporter permease [Solirubrobacterales bacterium]|nr:ABC transporter permease [Solirubrobacterales bacterium]MCB8971316.1 ABC transporter permease [Thermoleophilales bacterium]MCO5325826.1 ABC transporter permease [Solirubrobacterales bacterium]